MMSYRKRIRKDGRPVPGRGLRLPRKQRFQRELPTASDIRVRSQYEKHCVAYFESNRIQYHYEPVLLLGGRQYRPDFFLPEYNLFVEICGYGHMPYYRDRVVQKKQIYNKYQIPVLFLHYNGKGSLEKLLYEELKWFSRCNITTP
jgi:hypothetical protein